MLVRQHNYFIVKPFSSFKEPINYLIVEYNKLYIL